MDACWGGGAGGNGTAGGGDGIHGIGGNGTVPGVTPSPFEGSAGMSSMSFMGVRAGIIASLFWGQTRATSIHRYQQVKSCI